MALPFLPKIGPSVPFRHTGAIAPVAGSMLPVLKINARSKVEPLAQTYLDNEMLGAVGLDVASRQKALGPAAPRPLPTDFCEAVLWLLAAGPGTGWPDVSG